MSRALRSKLIDATVFFTKDCCIGGQCYRFFKYPCSHGRFGHLHRSDSLAVSWNQHIRDSVLKVAAVIVIHAFYSPSGYNHIDKYSILFPSHLNNSAGRPNLSKQKYSSNPLHQPIPQTKMFPDDFWPILFFGSTFICIGIFACLTFTVFSIILERRAANEATHTVEDDSSVESYYTFEQSFDGSFDDYASASGQRRASITPRKPLKQQQGRVLHTATTGRDFRLSQSGI